MRLTIEQGYSDNLDTHNKAVNIAKLLDIDVEFYCEDYKEQVTVCPDEEILIDDEDFYEMMKRSFGLDTPNHLIDEP